jgi:two-component system sensor histidine kinase TctE
VDSFNDYIERIERYTSLRNNFIQNAAHQLRTPLAILNTQISDALRAQSKQSGDAALIAARKTLQQTARLVHQFLTLSSAEAYSASKTLLSTQACCDIVQKVLEDMAVQAHGKQIDLGFERTGADSVVAADPAALREIVMNVVDNAIQYTVSRGVVTLRVQSAPGTIAVCVEDNGPGVPPEFREKIFQRFFRMNSTSSPGSGLGLAIVRELASHCGATIEVDAPTHGGSGLLVVIKFFRD